MSQTTSLNGQKRKKKKFFSKPSLVMTQFNTYTTSCPTGGTTAFAQNGPVVPFYFLLFVLDFPISLKFLYLSLIYAATVHLLLLLKQLLNNCPPNAQASKHQSTELKFINPIGIYLKNNKTYPRWPYNHSSPMCKCHVIIIFQAPTDCSIPNTSLTMLQFFQKTEVSRHN